MITITEIIKYYVMKEAQKIEQLKTAAIVKQEIEKYAYLSADGKQFRNKLPQDESLAEGWRWQKVKFTKITGHISPQDPRWRDYLALKHRVSMLLTARHLLKLNNEQVPEIDTVKRAIKEGRLHHHAACKRVKAVAYSAYRYLHKISNRLLKHPHRFIDQEEKWPIYQKTVSTKEDQHG